VWRGNGRPNERFQLAVFMLDGYLVRYRGAGWGKKKTKKKRVEWHEIKTGVFYLQEQAARTEGGRGVLSEKVVICWQGRESRWTATALGGRSVAGWGGRSGSWCSEMERLGSGMWRRPLGGGPGVIGFLSRQ